MDGSFITADGLTLSTYRLPAEATPFGPVILIHGLSDHARSEPYLRLGRHLAARGFEVFAFDRRGSGLSQGRANYAARWSDLREDLARFIDIVEDQCGRLPSLVGLSMGGLQALDFALHAPDSVRACVVMAPALDASGASPWLRRILPLLAAGLPRLSVDPGLDDRALVRDPEVCRSYRNDPLWRPRTTPALSLALLETIEAVQRHAPKLRSPLLVFHGTADRIVPIQGTRAFFPSAGSPDKTFIELPGAFHALPIEPEGAGMADRIAEWLAARSGPEAVPGA